MTKFTNTHPILTGKEIRAHREDLGLTLHEFGHILGYKSEKPERLRERMYEFESGKKQLPASQTRLLLCILTIVSDYDARIDSFLDELLKHGDFLN